MLLVNRYDSVRAAAQDMLQLSDITELLGLKLIGVVPESKAVRRAGPFPLPAQSHFLVY
jgi:septum site-determining protein MinD